MTYTNRLLWLASASKFTLLLFTVMTVIACALAVENEGTIECDHAGNLFLESGNRSSSSVFINGVDIQGRIAALEEQVAAQAALIASLTSAVQAITSPQLFTFVQQIKSSSSALLTALTFNNVPTARGLFLSLENIRPTTSDTLILEFSRDGSTWTTSGCSSNLKYWYSDSTTTQQSTSAAHVVLSDKITSNSYTPYGECLPDVDQPNGTSTKRSSQRSRALARLGQC